MGRYCSLYPDVLQLIPRYTAAYTWPYCILYNQSENKATSVQVSWILDWGWQFCQTPSQVNLWYWGLWFYSLKYLKFADFGLSWPFPSDGNSSVMTIITSMIWGLFNDLINFALLSQAVFGHFYTFSEQLSVIWMINGQLSGRENQE